MLTVELERLVANLRRLDRSVVDLLRPGVPRELVLLTAGLTEVPESVAMWFGWCNGVEARPGQLQDEVNIIPAYNPLSVEEAVYAKASYEGDAALGELFLPLLTTASGDIYAAVWDRNVNEARVAGVLVGEPTEVEFSSIEQMVMVFNACFDNGSFFVGAENRLIMDPEGYEQTYADVIGGA
ncbi:hypothetical protein [Luedemannella helvata]|uniref:Uncharacterized protein n=1 Tax=Luedemannella helvata TaxID=349315 RepID=A0ABN2KWY4_9ACTN